MADSPYTWIQTRDGSPTLWHNELGESFRSVKGAFTESWAAFVAPALEHARGHAAKPAWELGEFGLGAGTNWMLWTLAAADLPYRYTAIERDRRAFELGRARWIASAAQLDAFLRERGVALGEVAVRDRLAQAPAPRVFASLSEAAQAGARFDLWFHDPFGYDVNPDGYAPETLQSCAALWAPGLWGGSYACNSRFRRSLEALGGVRATVVPTGGAELGLKRERLEFVRT